MIPDIEHPAWRDLVEGRIELQPSCLALKFFLKRCGISLQFDPSPDARDGLVREAHEFFVKYERLVPDEIATLFPEESR